MADYADSELLELLPIEQLVRFLQPQSTAVALSLRATASASLWIPDVRVVKAKPLSALEDVVIMAEAIRKAADDSLQMQRQKVEENSIKLDEAKALRIEVNASPLVCVLVLVGWAAVRVKEGAEQWRRCSQAESLTSKLTSHVLRVGLGKGACLCIAVH